MTQVIDTRHRVVARTRREPARRNLFVAPLFDQVGELRIDLAGVSVETIDLNRELVDPAKRRIG